MSNPEGTLRVSVLFFASAQDLAGTSRDSMVLAAPATLADAEAALRQRHAWLGSKLKSYRIALNQEFARPDAPVADGAELAIIPPVSGG